MNTFIIMAADAFTPTVTKEFTELASTQIKDALNLDPKKIEAEAQEKKQAEEEPGLEIVALKAVYALKAAQRAVDALPSDATPDQRDLKKLDLALAKVTSD